MPDQVCWVHLTWFHLIDFNRLIVRLLTVDNRLTLWTVDTCPNADTVIGPGGLLHTTWPGFAWAGPAFTHNRYLIYSYQAITVLGIETILQRP